MYIYIAGKVFLNQSKFSEMENGPLLLVLELKTFRLHAKWFNPWAMEMRHLPTHGILALAI